MDKRYALLVAVLGMASPLAYAHTDGTPYGVPKIYCEDLKGDEFHHDYGPPATGLFIAFAVDGAIPPCPYDPLWDGHYEWAVGGAWLLACDGPCFGPPKPGDGAAACWLTYADHAPFDTIYVHDVVLTRAGVPVPFVVAADYVDLVPPSPDTPNCGDFESDISVACVDSCVPPFPPGKDGSYQVYVSGTAGHVSTVPECADGFDNDGDGPIDGADTSCAGPGDNNEWT